MDFSDRLCADLAQLIPSSKYLHLRGSFDLFNSAVELILILDTVELNNGFTSTIFGCSVESYNFFFVA